MCDLWILYLLTPVWFIVVIPHDDNSGMVTFDTVLWKIFDLARFYSIIKYYVCSFCIASVIFTIV